MARLVKVINSKQTSISLNLIFIHGLGGNWESTWGFDNEESWKTWLSKDCPEIAAWSYDYDASPTSWGKGQPMPLVERATNLLMHIKSEITSGPIVLMCHSMGGLLAKQILRNANDSRIQFLAILERIRGIVFLSTPHQGSVLASFTRKLHLLTKKTVVIDDLASHNPALTNLGNWFRDNFEMLDLEIITFYETRKTEKFGIGSIVVDRDSANPGIANKAPVPVEADHIDISKPINQSDTAVYANTRDFIKDLIPIPDPELESVDYLKELFSMWIISGKVDPWVLTAFFHVILKRGESNPREIMQGWIEYAKIKASNATEIPISELGSLEIDLHINIEDLSLKDSFYRLWKRAVQEGKASNMAKVQGELISVYGSDHRTKLLTEWNRNLGI